MRISHQTSVVPQHTLMAMVSSMSGTQRVVPASTVPVETATTN